MRHAAKGRKGVEFDEALVYSSNQFATNWAGRPPMLFRMTRARYPAQASVATSPSFRQTSLRSRFLAT